MMKEIGFDYENRSRRPIHLAIDYQCDRHQNTEHYISEKKRRLVSDKHF